MTMGEKIQLLRKKQNWSQETLAEKLSVSRQAVSLWERDESQPELDKLLKLAKIFSVTTDYLIDDSVTEIASPVSCGKTSFENNPKKKERKPSHHRIFSPCNLSGCCGTSPFRIIMERVSKIRYAPSRISSPTSCPDTCSRGFSLVRSSSAQKSDASPMVCKKHVASASYSCSVAESCYIFSASFSLPWHTSRYAFPDYVPYDLSSRCTVFK